MNSDDIRKPMWVPDQATIDAANVTHFMHEVGLGSYDELYAWSVDEPRLFWRSVIDRLEIHFRKSPTEVLSLSAGVSKPEWLVGSQLNIVESCLAADGQAAAIVAANSTGELTTVTYAQLSARVRRVAASIQAAGFVPGDRLAIVMPMNVESVVIYLGILYAGCAAVSIADSFAAPEISKRLEISAAKAAFCCDKYLRGSKEIDLYSRVIAAGAKQAIVLPLDDVNLRTGDMAYDDFLVEEAAAATLAPVIQSPNALINVLFSSGTTGDPKAIPWDQTMPIKCAADGFFHHDIRTGDVVCWPTNLGWMMGPWLIFASLLNRATIALYHDTPMTAGFGHFVTEARVTMLGVVPTIVRAWRSSGAMESCDWSAVRCFSSTGESSHPDDMEYLSHLAGSKPVIEYCGGTEIGGGYVTSTVVQPNVASAFSTPALGSRFVILDSEYRPTEEGQLFLVPPAMGLSRTLLNRDHRATYYEGLPLGPDGEVLRRHGDHFRRLPGGYFQAGGRVDDTMNLGGIKTSSAEIEQVLDRLELVSETAAISISLDGKGPDQLVVFVVPENAGSCREEELLATMNHEIRRSLNPLFKIAQVRIVATLPRTASNKVMRRELRREFVPR